MQWCVVLPGKVWRLVRENVLSRWKVTMKFDVTRPLTKSEQVSAKADELDKLFSDRTKREVMLALARAVVDAQELAENEQAYGQLLALVALQQGTPVGDGRDELRLVVTSERVEEHKVGGFQLIIDRSVAGDVVLRVVKRSAAKVQVEQPIEETKN